MATHQGKAAMWIALESTNPGWGIYHAHPAIRRATEEQPMHLLRVLSVVSILAVLAACTSPQDRAAQAQKGAYNAQEEVAKKRLDLTDKYQKCVKDAGADQQKAAACESYLKAAEALR